MAANKAGARLRAEAAKTLDAVASSGRSLDAALAVADKIINPSDRPLLHMLCYGSLRYHHRLRWQLGQLLDRPLKARDIVIESLLVIGLYQLGDTRVPDHAAVSMTVEAARLLRRPKYAGLVNAVLRNFIRRGVGQWESADDEVRFSHPTWLIRRLQHDWPDEWQQIIAANNARAPMWLRVNPLYMDAPGYLQGLQDAAIEADDLPAGAELLRGAKQAIRLQSPLRLGDIPRFAEGVVSIQDAGAQLAAPWLLDGGATRVLDACAAPGGKTGHLLELMGPGADLIAIDADSARLDRVNENLDRLGLAATTINADASRIKDWWDGQPFDKILLDVPCSASGVIRRHPDIKILRRETDIATLAALQREMLEALWTVLEPGGRLLYVTCSVLAAENEDVAGAFLARHEDASENRVLHDYNIRDLMCERRTGFQVLPGTKGLDGFYFAALEKAAASA